jgi:hypothetical protein
MGDLTNTLRKTETEVNAMLLTGGEYDETTNFVSYKLSDVYNDLTVGGTTSKNSFAQATSKWFTRKVMAPLIIKVGSKYADKIRQLSNQVSKLNKELTGSDMLSPVDAESVRYDETLALIMITLKKRRKVGRQITRVETLIDEKSTALFGIDSDDSDYEAEKGEFDGSAAAELQTLKTTRTALVKEQDKDIKDFYTKVSGGMYIAEEKNATTQKLVMPTGKVGASGKMYIAKMLYFCESQPQKFGWCLHEIRRTLKDYNKRKGTYYCAPDSSEVDEKIRERFITSNTALYKEFQVQVPAADFAAAHRTYNYGTNGGSCSDPWPCAENNGLRILHYFITRLVKVDCEHVENVEAELLSCPTMFGMGDPQAAVEKTSTLLDEAERVDAQVGYRVVLRICDVLSKRHPLFASLHAKKLQPSAITERRNARPEMFRLMTDISTILINIGENTAHWKANQIQVDIGIKTYNCIVLDANTQPVIRETVVSNVDTKINQVGNAGEERKRKAAPTGNSSSDKPTCQYKDCTRPAFCHKKERGGEMHASKMCFDHFLLGVEDSKLQKPLGIPIKGGKTMVAKRGDDKKWEYKIFNVQMNNELAALRRETFLKTISNENAEELLNQLHVEFEKEDNGTRVYNTNAGNNEGNEVKWDMYTEDSAGAFELPECGDVIKIFDIKRQKLQSCLPEYSLYQDEQEQNKY